MLGKIEEFERGRRLLVTDISVEPRDGEALEGIRLELTFAEREGGCVVTVAQDVPDAGPAYERYRARRGPGGRRAWRT